MRFLCDEMLGRLARLLRAAGHDAALAAPGAADANLIDKARGEGRMLLTRDRSLASAAGANGLLVAGGTTEAQAAQVGAAFALDWLASPFTRCLIDNTPLRPASAEEIAAMPASARTRPGPMNACPACGRLYWPGSHVKRLLEKLEALRLLAVPSRAPHA